MSSRNSLLLLAVLLAISAPGAPAVLADDLLYNPYHPGYHPGPPAYYLRYRVLAPDWFERRDTITLQAGDALAANKAMQMRDPWPPYVHDQHILFHGEVIVGAIERYRRGPRAVPPPATGSEFGAWTLNPRERQP
jgi:hypothetical protein